MDVAGRRSQRSLPTLPKFKAVPETDVDNKYHVCGEDFSKKAAMKKHQQVVHTEFELYSCQDRSKHFSQRGDLEKHKLSHTGEMPHHCGLCGKSFANSGSLKRHLRTVHTGEKPFHCGHCGKRFSRAEHLKEHKNIHTGQKPYHCGQCGKPFSRLREVKLHERTQHN